MPYIQNECGIRSIAEDIHAYSEGRHRSPEEYGSVEDFIWDAENVLIIHLFSFKTPIFYII